MAPEPIRAALSVPLPSDTTAPADIHYMPPGRHTIRARRGGKPVTVTVLVDAATAETLQQFLTAQLAAAAKGNEDRPFLDFNHDDREAAAWPTEFFWAGDDPKSGGVWLVCLNWGRPGPAVSQVLLLAVSRWKPEAIIGCSALLPDAPPHPTGSRLRTLSAPSGPTSAAACLPILAPPVQARTLLDG